MIVLSEKLSDIPILSLQTGGELGRTVNGIIDPRNMSIIALYITGSLVNERPAVLHVEDIREIADMGYIIDDSSKIMPLDGLVRLREVIDFNFHLVGLPVHDRAGQNLGKVSDYTFDAEGFTIQQLYVNRPFLKSLTTSSLIIARSQLISVANDKIIVDTPTINAADKSQTDAKVPFANPFRSPPQTSLE